MQTTKSTYEQQAEDFLKSCGATIEAQFLYFGPYFPDDKDKRDVYSILIRRPEKTPWVFNFGQSVVHSGGHIGHRQKERKPTAYDILTCLEKYDIGTFEDFCGEFGYDADSRKAEQLYFTVQKEAKECQRMFGDVMEKLQEIQ